MDYGHSYRQERVMAVRLADYYKKLWRRLVLIAIILNVAVSGLAFAWLLLGGTTDDLLEAAIGAAPIFVLQLVVTLLLLFFGTKPLKMVADAITHVSKQANNVTPPNVNKTRYEKSGLKVLVQTVYDLAIKDDAGSQDGSAVSGDFSANLLAQVPCGIIALNKERKVIYANPLAPVKTDTNQAQQIELLFSANDGLNEWLNGCEQQKVKDSHLWTRVADKLPEEENRRIFDVFASYQKEGSVAETIIVTVDRTADYAPAQEDMDFIALAAHELRGPITVIRGYLDILAEEMQPQLTKDQIELMERLSVSANRLSSYINNILNVSRYDRKHLKLHLHEEHVEDIVKGLIDDLAMRARTQNRLLSISIPPELPTIAADKNSLGEVVVNLVDNAIKYSNEGGQIIVSAGIKGNFVEFKVQDFGIGIPSSVIGNLFSKFYRSHRSRQSVSGTGLGLYICKAIVESHGGQIAASSVEGHGSTFTFTVPIYSTVADKLKANDNGNEGIIESGNGWIKNHSMYRG